MASETSNSLKGPDAFQVKAITLMDRLARNPKPLLIILGLVLLVSLGAFGIRFAIGKKQEDRKLALTKIDQVFEAEMKRYSQERDVLEKQKDALIASQPSPKNPGEVPAESPEIQALNSKIKVIKPDTKESSEKYRAFYEGHQKFPEGWVAGLRYAAYAIEQKDLEGAQKVLEGVAKEAKDHPVLRIQSLLLLISVLEDRSEFDKALEHSETLIGIASDKLKPKAILTKAQLLYMKKDFANAKLTLEKLLNEHGSSAEADRARGLMTLIPV